MLSKDLLWTGLLLVGPAVITSLVVGLVVSIIQTITSIQEQTLSFAPRILAVGVVIALTLPWSFQVITLFTEKSITYILEVPF
ncbi:flagellar biosynthetic protein FliQ [Pirellulaceae bacterium]|jgi:flagellar biosynthetic protein FliQ|nr:flagellar biosynthetic protein FliQ [Pirellulaceae bacterium]